MIGWLRRMLDRSEPPKTVENTEVRHKAALTRADRLLARVEAYRAADVARRNRAK